MLAEVFKNEQSDCIMLVTYTLSTWIPHTHTHTHTPKHTHKIIHAMYALSKTTLKFPMFIIHFHYYILINSKVKLHTH